MTYIDRIAWSLWSEADRSTMLQRHICIAIRNGRPITPVCVNYVQTKVMGKYLGSMHAEMAAMQSLIQNVRPFIHTPHKIRRKFSKVIIVVIRVSRAGKLLNSKPCADCLGFMKQLGFKQICYSTDDGLMIRETVSEAESTHMSGARRNLSHCRVI